jgi:phosphoribosylformylglycinamidine cyclo-ligase
VIRGDAWPRPALFRWLQEKGGIDDAEMHRVFNCGVGLVLAVAARDAERAERRLRRSGETVYRIGEVVKGRGEPEAVIA